MKILKKRVYAIIIDTFILGTLLVVCQTVFRENLFKVGRVVELILLMLFFFKDLTFRNASIGKKLMGIAVYDIHWKAPKIISLVKRTFFILPMGCLLFWKALFVDGKIISFFDWEREKLGTRVVDNKVLKKLSIEAKGMKGDFSSNLDILYSAYLRDLYMKQ